MAHLCTQMHLRGSAVDMEFDDEGSGDKPDGCEVEDTPTEAPSTAAVDAPPTQPEGEAFAASSSTQMHLPVLLWTWNPMARAPTMNQMAVRQRTHQQRHLQVQLLMWPRPHSLKGSLCSFFKALSPGAVYSGTSSKFTFFFFIRLFSFFPFSFCFFSFHLFLYKFIQLFIS